MKLNNNWNIFDHEWAVNLLKNHLVRGRIRHAYLFTGPQGIGRRTLALRLAQGINCMETESPGVPCGVCRSCHLFENMQHPDLTIVQADRLGGNLKVDQIRELQSRLSLTPYEAQYRVALLLRFEEANPNAANALLKTLEEPQPRVVLMLTARDPDCLLPTIVSRCKLIRLRPSPLNQVSKELQTQVGLPMDEANMLAHISGGRPGYALQLHYDPDQMQKRQVWLEDLHKLLSAKRPERLAYAESLARDRETLGSILEIWSSFWRDILLVVLGSSVPVTNLDWRTEINTLANKLNPQKTKEMVDILNRTSLLIEQNVNTRLALEVLMLDLPHILP